MKSPPRVPNRYIFPLLFFTAGLVVGVLLARTPKNQPRNADTPLPSPAPTTTAATTTVNENSDNPDTADAVITVARVIDGDTIELSDGSRVRYIGINTPELKHGGTAEECFAIEAKAANEKLVLNKSVRLERDVSETDRYGRLLRYIYVGNTFVNLALVADGFAYASPYPPDVAHNDDLRAAMVTAREQGKGLWSGCPTSGTTASTPSAPAPAPEGCAIKGNINAKGEKIYHLPGCGSYSKTFIDETQGEQWFCTEAEATAAGFRKAGNCP
ncbi:MAG: thermonuclease family protein [Patescibacteria group bacterium]|nr:thermonuclease family protein [Patescibacteria group bacterium]